MSEIDTVLPKLHDISTEEMIRLYYENPKEYAAWEKRDREIRKEILTAVKNGDLESCASLLKESPRVINNYYGERYLTLLHIAAANGYCKICKILIESGTNVDIRDESFFDRPLHFAVQNGHMEVCKLLTDYGADVNAMGGLWWTPLYWAVHQGHLEIGKLLIEKGADVNFKDPDRLQTPIFNMAERTSDPQFADLLIENGADVNAADHNLVTPLMMAVRRANFDAVKKFIKLGADVNAKTYKGVTCLHYAARLVYTPEMIQICTLLLKHGARIDAADNEGRTPLDWAGSDNKVKKFLVKMEGVKPTVATNNPGMLLNCPNQPIERK